MTSGQIRAIVRDPPEARGEHTRPPDGSVAFEVTLLPTRGVAPQPQRRTYTLSRIRRIGSGGLNHIVIDGEGIAAYHAQLIPGTPTPVLVLDGTTALLNGVGVSGSVGLIPGDIMSFGEHNLRVSASGLDDKRVSGQDVAWRLVSGAGNASIALTSEVLIGSAATSAICLKEPDIAARHAQLVLRRGTLWVRDFSGGVTFVNAEPVNGAQRLQHEDVLRIGPLDFRVVHELRVADEALGSITTVGVAEHPVDSSILDPVFVAEVLPAAEVRADAPRSTPAIWEIDEPVAVTATAALSVELTEVWRASVFEVPTLGVPLAAAKERVAVLHAAVDPHVGAADVRPRESPRSPEHESAFVDTGSDAPWGVPVLILLLTAAMAIAMWTPEHPVDPNRISDHRVVNDAFDRARDTARSLQDVAVGWLSRATAETPRYASDATATPAEPPQAVAADTSTSAVIPFVTQDLLELQRKAAAGDAAAIKRVAKLTAVYAELASSATARGDSATAQRNMAMGELMTPTHATAETAVTAPPPVSVEHPASPAEALAFDARQLQSRGAASAQDGRSGVSVLVEALRLQPGNAEAKRDLNLAIDSLNGQLRTLIADHRFRAAGALLAQLSRDGIRVLSNGNIRDRPAFLDARVWRSLAVSSLLVEADDLIQQGLLATPDQENALARLEVATRLDPTNPLLDDMRATSSGMLSLAADRASDAGLNEEARRLSNLAAYVRDDFGA